MFIKEVKCQRQVKMKTINCSSIIVSFVKSFKWQYCRWVNLTWFLNKNIWKLYLNCTSNIISSNLSKYLTIWINYDYCRSLWKMTKYFFFCLFFFLFKLIFNFDTDLSMCTGKYTFCFIVMKINFFFYLKLTFVIVI